MARARHEIRFLLNGTPVRLADMAPEDTLLDYLRLERRLRGTKEGCAEGDCGACTVLVGRLRGADLRYEPVNACIRLLPSLDGCHVVTVEHLRSADGRLHPVQQAMVDHHASQCGFCTPGIVMSLYALWLGGGVPSTHEIETALQGNLCRCTGYRPIIEAARAASQAGGQADDNILQMRDQVIAQLRQFDDETRVVVSKQGRAAILPADIADLADALGDHPDATIIAGATDVGLWVTKHMRNIAPAIFISHIEDLSRIDVTDDGITIGATASYSDAEAIITEHHPHLRAFWQRIGGWQVRNMGTVGGNIANGSPIGDTPPALIALGATLVLTRRGVSDARAIVERRTLALEDYFLDYGKQDRAPGEFVESVYVPHARPGTLNAAYKVSKRRDEDISSVCAGFSIRLEGDRVAGARIAFGGMAATPKRARACEAALIGHPWKQESIARAQVALAADFTPITDMRASAGYRAIVARNLLQRFFLETATSQGVTLQRSDAA